MKSIHASVDMMKSGSKRNDVQFPKIQNSFRGVNIKNDIVAPFQLKQVKQTHSHFKISPRIEQIDIDEVKDDGNNSPKPKTVKLM